MRAPARHSRAVLLILFSDKISVDGAVELMLRVANPATSVLEAINGQICTSLLYRPMKPDGETIERLNAVYAL